MKVLLNLALAFGLQYSAWAAMPPKPTARYFQHTSFETRFVPALMGSYSIHVLNNPRGEWEVVSNRACFVNIDEEDETGEAPSCVTENSTNRQTVIPRLLEQESRTSSGCMRLSLTPELEFKLCKKMTESGQNNVPSLIVRPTGEPATEVPLYLQYVITAD